MARSSPGQEQPWPRGCLQEEDQRSGNAAPVVLFQSRARASSHWSLATSERRAALEVGGSFHFRPLFDFRAGTVCAANCTKTVGDGSCPCARSLPVACFFFLCVCLSVSVPLSLPVAPCLGFFFSRQISKIAQTLNNCQPFGCAN